MRNHGVIWWNEYNTWDAEKACAYYGAVMKWEFEAVETAGTLDARPYYIAKKDGQMVAGIFTLIKPMFEGIPDHWFTYIAVDDLHQAIADSNANGGKVLREPFEIPNFGKFAVIGDANGGALGFIEPAG